MRYFKKWFRNIGKSCHFPSPLFCLCAYVVYVWCVCGSLYSTASFQFDATLPLFLWLMFRWAPLWSSTNQTFLQQGYAILLPQSRITLISPSVSNTRRSFHLAFSQELLFCGIDSCVDTSQNATILTPSFQRSVVIYPLYFHFLPPLLSFISRTSFIKIILILTFRHE